MTTRQAGHFFFEPRGYDHVNQATDEHKEAIKVGYNIRRKIVLLRVWVLSRCCCGSQPSLFGLIEPADVAARLRARRRHRLAGAGRGRPAVPRRLQLWLQQDLRTGLVWVTKILTDPFHDIVLYHRAPLQLLRGELIDPMPHVRHR